MPHRAHEQNPPNQYHVLGHGRPELLLHEVLLARNFVFPRWASPRTGRSHRINAALERRKTKKGHGLRSVPLYSANQRSRTSG